MIKILKNIILFFSILTIPFGVTLAWNGLIAQNGDLLNILKWNELIGELALKISADNIIAGNGINITQSGSNVTITAQDNTALNQEIISVNSGICEVSNTAHAGFLNAFVEEITVVASGNEIVPSTFNDFGGSTNSPENVLNNNYTDLLYGPSGNTAMVSIDLGGQESIGFARIYWWNPQTYGSINGKIQASTDGNTWVDVVTGITKNTGVSGDFNDYTFSGDYRYVRYFSINGVNATWFAMSELEVYSPSGTLYDYPNIFDTNFDVNNKNGFIEICNNSANNSNVEINSIG